MRLPRVLLKLGISVASTAMVLIVVETGLRLHAWATDPARVGVEKALEASRRAGLPTNQETTSLLGLVRPSLNPFEVYELKPNLDGTFLGKAVRTNNHGMRGPDVKIEKPPGTRRIVGIGDSVMFGWGVEAEESFMGILAEELARRSPATEVLNLATPGYNTVMEVERFKDKGLVFDPDLVLLSVVNNDFDLPRFLLQPRNVLRLDRCYLIDLFRGAAGSVVEGRWLQPQDLDNLSDGERERIDDRFGFLLGEEAFAGAMADLAAVCADRGIQVVVILPSCNGEMWSTVCRIATGHGFSILKIGPRLSEHLIESEEQNNREGWIRTFWLSQADPHPNPLAHRIHAAAILEWVDTYSPYFVEKGRESAGNE